VPIRPVRTHGTGTHQATEGGQTGPVSIGPWLEGLFDRSGGDGTPYLDLDPGTASARAREAGVVDIRIIPIPFPSGVAMQMDSRPFRLNLAVEDGRVVRAGFF
jgi:hypothetical protein